MELPVTNPLSDTTFPGRTVAYTATAGSTDPWNPGPQVVLVWATTAAYISVGEGVTATTSSTPIPANTIVHFTVPPGTGAPWRVSAIRAASDGSVYCKPLNLR